MAIKRLVGKSKINMDNQRGNMSEEAWKVAQQGRDDYGKMLKGFKRTIGAGAAEESITPFERTMEKIAGNKMYAKRLYNYQVDKMNHPIAHLAAAAGKVTVGTGLGLTLVGSAALAGAAAIKYKQKQTESDIDKYRNQTSKNADDLMKALKRQRKK